MKNLLMTFSLLLSISAFGETVEQARELYAKRGEDPAFAQQAADIYGTLATQATDWKEKVEMMIKRSEATYYVAAKIEDDKARELKHTEGQGIAAEGVELAKANGDAELQARALYWDGANMGKAGEARGVLSSLGQWPELKKKMQMIIRLKQNHINFYGANRVLGRAYYKLPFPLGSTKKSLRFLKEAYEKSVNADGASNHGINILYYAETLISSGDKAEAKRILDEFLAQDANTLNPERIPETFEEQEDARELLRDL